MYSKLITAGNCLEHYLYEKQPYTGRKNKRDSSILRNTSEGYIKERRKDNTRRTVLAFKRLLLSNFERDNVPVFCTFTFAKEQDLSTGYKLFNLFAKRLRKKLGSNIRYVSVPEFGTKSSKRLHFHALIWGLPLELVKRERKTRYFQEIWSYGFVDMVITDNNVKIGYYLAKYLSKTYNDNRFFNRNSYIASRNIRRPQVITDFVSLALDYAYPDKVLQEKTTYDTLHLGQCDYSLYLIT